MDTEIKLELCYLKYISSNSTEPYFANKILILYWSLKLFHSLLILKEETLKFKNVAY